MDKSIYLSFAALPILTLGGLTGFAVAGSHASANNTTVKTSHAVSATARKTQSVALTVLPGGRLGSDGKLHDVVTNADFTVVQGVPVKLTVYNYDGGKHSITDTTLGFSLQAKGSPKNGVPGVTTLTFVPKRIGNTTWQCMDTCDSEQDGWAMVHDGYMKGTVHVVPNTTKKQFVYLTIKDGLQYSASDKQLHDSYSPASFTVKAGIPVQVRVENYDTGQHSLTSSGLNINPIFAGAKKAGVPSISTFTFVPKATGKFSWQCIIPCDGDGWAMTHKGYMSGTIIVN